VRAALFVAVTVATLAAADYTPVKSWSGAGTKETETFTITTREWRVTWTAVAERADFAGGAKNFDIGVYKDGGSQFPLSSISAGASETKGESFVRGAGRYYLKISALNAKWTVAVDESH
jgi:hypothetical protein